MEVAIHLPDDIAHQLQARHADMARYALESMALEGYRSRTLTTEEVRQLLGLEDRWAVHEFLQAHDVAFYTVDDLQHDFATLDRLRPQ